jgi:hypothetical protein
MPTNRDYTGLVRTPSSMAWLIRESAKLKGRIAYLEKQQAEIPARLEAFRAQLRALEAVIPLHDVEVDPAVIQPRRPKRKSVTAYGGMTRAIYEFLRERRDATPPCTTEVALYISKTCGIAWSTATKVEFVKRVSKRLCALAAAGEVLRHHDITRGANEEGRWSLSDA